LEESPLFTEVRKGNSINASPRELVCGSEVKIKAVSEQALLNGSLRAELTNCDRKQKIPIPLSATTNSTDPFICFLLSITSLMLGFFVATCAFGSSEAESLRPLIIHETDLK
jgi:hypothetical protein